MLRGQETQRIIMMKALSIISDLNKLPRRTKGILILKTNKPPTPVS